MECSSEYHIANPLEVLERFGPLWQMVDEGKLCPQVKYVLGTLSEEERRTYFCKAGRGAWLLFQICFDGNYSEVQYAFETLKLHQIKPDTLEHSEQPPGSPLQAALLSPVPSVAIIKYVISNGYAVTPEDYSIWTSCQLDRRHLKAILGVLLEHGRQSLPAVRELFQMMSNPDDWDGTEPYVDRYSVHLDILRKVLPFTEQDMQAAAFLGYGRFLEQMVVAHEERGHYINRDVLADLFEVCEFASYIRSEEFPRELRYLRKSLELRQSPRGGEMIYFGSRTQVVTLNDLERIEEQMRKNDYLECTWQMLLAGARANAMKAGVNSNAMRGLVTLDQALEVKSFVMSSGHFLGDHWTFIINFIEQCEYITEMTPVADLAMLPVLYDCFEDIFIYGDEVLCPRLIHSIATILAGASTGPDILGQLESVRERRDEVLFLIVYGLHKPNSVLGVERTFELAAPIILRLLKMGASLGTLPGHSKSILRLILSGAVELTPAFLNALRGYACCALDLLPSERKSLGFPEKVTSPLSLKCLAAAQCSKFPRGILKEHLPSGLVSMAAGHPKTGNSNL